MNQIIMTNRGFIMALALKKNKYQEALARYVKEHEYTVANPVNMCIELTGKVVGHIAADLGFDKVFYKQPMTTTDTDVVVKRFASAINRTCIDVTAHAETAVTGILNQQFKGGVSIVTGIGIRISKLKDNIFINGLDPLGAFNDGTDAKLEAVNYFTVAIDRGTNKAAVANNIKAIHELIDKITHYFRLDETFTVSLAEYNALIKEINKLNTRLANLEEEFKSGSVKIKRDKTIAKNIENAFKETTIFGFADIKKAALEISNEMKAVGWVNVESKIVKENDDIVMARMSFMDAKVHPSVVYITIDSKEISFYILKVVGMFDISTGHQQTERDLLHKSTSMVDAKSYILSGLCQ